MKKNFLISAGIAILFTGLLFLSGCSRPWGGGSDSVRLKAAATIFPIYDILKEVGGEKVETTLIVPPGSSPHTFSLTPSIAKKLQKTDLFLAVGGEFDGWWARSFSDSLGSREYLELADFIELQPFAFEHNHEDEKGENDSKDGKNHGEEGLDPHFWLDPLNAPIIAEQIALALSRLDSDNAKYYQERAEDFSRRAREKTELWNRRLTELESREFIVFHDAWGYFARRFDLDIVAVFEPFPGKSPSPKYLEQLQQEVIQHDIKVLFIEPQLSATAIKAVADDLGLQIATLDPIGGVFGRETYLELIDYNVETLAAVLSTK